MGDTAGKPSAGGKYEGLPHKVKIKPTVVNCVSLYNNALFEENPVSKIPQTISVEQPYGD